MKIKTALLAAAALVCMSGSAEAATIVNGSFEFASVDPGGGFLTLGPLNTSITGWTVGGAGIDYIGGYWQAAQGIRSLDLSALSGGSVTQTLATIVGKTYTVTFSLAGNPDGPDDGKIAVTSVSGSLPQIDIFTVGPANTHANMGWKTFIYTFTAFDTSSDLTFASATNTPFGPALDNVSISAIPEPATWAMMIIGFGAAGGAIRSARRRGALGLA